MKKTLIFSVISFFLFSIPAFFAEDYKIREFQARGEVVSVDPVYAQITISHGAIKNFAGADQTVFSVSDRDLLKTVSKGDLVEFHLMDVKGDVHVDRLLKTGVASAKEGGFPIGRAMQDVLEGTGEVVKGVTTPIAPAHEVAAGVVDATTDATGSALNDASTEKITKF